MTKSEYKSAFAYRLEVWATAAKAFARTFALGVLVLGSAAGLLGGAIAREAGAAVGLGLAVATALGLAFASARIHAANVSRTPAYRFHNPWIGPRNR